MSAGDHDNESEEDDLALEPQDKSQRIGRLKNRDSNVGLTSISYSAMASEIEKESKEEDDTSRSPKSAYSGNGNTTSNGNSGGYYYEDDQDNHKEDGEKIPETRKAEEAKKSVSFHENGNEILVIEDDGDDDDDIRNSFSDEKNQNGTPYVLPASLTDRFSSWKSRFNNGSATLELTRAQLSPRDEDEEDDSYATSSVYSSEATNASSSIFNTKSTLQWAAATVVDQVQNYRGRYQGTSSGNSATASTMDPSVAAPEGASTSGRAEDNASTSAVMASTPTRPPPPPPPRYSQHIQNLLDQLEPHEYLLLLGRGMLGVNLKQSYVQGVYVDYLVEHGTAALSKQVYVGDTLLKINEQNLQRETILNVPQYIAQARRPAHLVLATGVPSTFVNYIDVCVGLLYQEQGSDLLSSSIPVPTNLLRPEHPSEDVAQSFEKYVPMRNNQEGLFHDHEQQQEQFKMILLNPSLRNALQHALLLCIIDPRRLPFVKFPSHEAHLLLFLELWTFQELYDVTPIDKRREVTYKIAYKFFLPTIIQGELVPPMFDFHHIVLDSELRKLEQQLSNTSLVDRNIFDAFTKNVLETLLEPFLEFLVSQDCSRMRGYLRQTAPFRNIPICDVLELRNDTSRNFVAHVVAYLLGQKDKEVNGEYDTVLEPNGQRVENAALGISGALFIRDRLIPALDRDDIAEDDIIDLFDQFWEQFAAPGVGALDQVAKNSEAADYLIAFRSLLGQLRSLKDRRAELAQRLRSEEIRVELVALANELIYDYANTNHVKFKAHKYHEWMMSEMDSQDQLKTGSVKKLFRKATFPTGVSTHKHTHGAEASSAIVDDDSYTGIDCALVFGPAEDFGNAERSDEEDETGSREEHLPKYSTFCTAVLEGSRMSIAEIPSGLESYAAVHNAQDQRSFDIFSKDVNRSEDGCDVYFVNYSVPQAEKSPENVSSLFGVSLVVTPRQQTLTSDSVTIEFRKASDENTCGTVFYERVEATEEDDDEEEEEPRYILAVFVNGDVNELNTALADLNTDPSSSKLNSSFGITLMSKKNTILSMRDSLRLLFEEYTQLPNNQGSFHCGALLSILKLSQKRELDFESVVRSMMKPLIYKASLPWLGRPLSDQRDAFIQISGDSLVKTLPPVPLALVFITMLLEQKLVITSSRRSLLLSCTTALQQLLNPLHWCHLLVPLVPPKLAADLLQYPAPFILGLASENPGTMQLVRDLPEDVTLVDLDVGRVILAPKLSHHEMLQTDIRVLRSQVLYLAQSLGNVFGRSLYPDLWNSDGIPTTNVSGVETASSPFDKLRGTCQSLVKELLSGTTSCCYWFEEAQNDIAEGQKTSMEATILFDEDRFIRLKSVRSQNGTVLPRLFAPVPSVPVKNGIALSPNDFGLVLQVMLRCQWMNDYIGRCPKEDMIYYTV